MHLGILHLSISCSSVVFPSCLFVGKKMDFRWYKIRQQEEHWPGLIKIEYNLIAQDTTCVEINGLTNTCCNPVYYHKVMVSEESWQDDKYWSQGNEKADLVFQRKFSQEKEVVLLLVHKEFLL